MKNMNHDFLPVCREDMEKRGWKSVDFAYIIGDGYVDHPSFGHAIISRLLESRGYRVGIISQPDWKDPESICIYGEPRLGFLVSAGNMDSMVNHYSVSKKRRRTDAYTPGGEMGKRPDHACVVYGNLIRQKYKKTAVIMGGIEASLRRMAHYDYWSDKLKRSILLDSGADIVSYGMGERSILEIAEALEAGIPIEEITYIDGTVVKIKEKEKIYDAQFLPSYEELKADRKMYAKSFYTQYLNTDAFSGKRLAEPYSEHLYVVQNPPSKPLSVTEMDDIYDLPYMRTYHPSYKAKGGIPAISEIRFSLISNRGCFGGCSFCALTFHQGRIVQVRSHESLIKEAEQMVEEKDFKGYIHDVGGPTANFRHGTTNYMMTKMFFEGADYAEVLKEAQDKGYAERNPEADVEGHDACRKIAILTSLISGQHVDFEKIHTEGITKITTEDMKYAKKLNMAIKLLASSKRVGDTFSVLVAPMLLSEEHPLCNVNDVFNAVFVRGNMLGDAMFYGSGAGKLPTASAVVADVVDAAKHLHRNVVTRWDAGELELIPNAEAEHRFFVRVQGRSEAQKEQIREAFGSVEIVETEGLEDEFGFITEVMTEGTYSKKAEAFPEIIHMIRLAD